MEEKKKGSLGIIICLVILVLGLAGYICYDKLIKKSAKKENEVTAIVNENDNIVFYEKDKAISSFNCDGTCEIFAFGEYPDPNMNEPVKESDYKYINSSKEEKDERFIDLKGSDYVLIAYCPKDVCDSITSYVSSIFNDEDSKKNIGSVVIFNIKTGKYKTLEDINSIHLFSSSAFILDTIIDEEIKIIEGTDSSYYNDYVSDYSLVFNDGTSRKLENKLVTDWCWEGPCSYVVIDDSIVSINKDGKYGVEDIKTGKEVVEHKYETISYVSNNYFTKPLKENNNSYLMAKENGKTNLYEFNNGLKQITKEGYEVIYFINPTTLFVYKDGNFYTMDLQENILSEKINVNIKEFERLPHEASVMFKKIDDNSLFIRIKPDLYNGESVYYKYDLNNKEFVKVTVNDVCPENQAVDACF